MNFEITQILKCPELGSIPIPQSIHENQILFTEILEKTKLGHTFCIPLHLLNQIYCHRFDYKQNRFRGETNHFTAFPAKEKIQLNETYDLMMVSVASNQKKFVYKIMGKKNNTQARHTNRRNRDAIDKNPEKMQSNVEWSEVKTHKRII